MILHVLIAMLAGWLQRHQQQVIAWFRRNFYRSIYSSLSRVNTGWGAVPLLTVYEPIA